MIWNSEESLDYGKCRLQECWNQEGRKGYHAK